MKKLIGRETDGVFDKLGQFQAGSCMSQSFHPALVTNIVPAA